MGKQKLKGKSLSDDFATRNCEENIDFLNFLHAFMSHRMILKHTFQSKCLVSGGLRVLVCCRDEIAQRVVLNNQKMEMICKCASF